MYDQPRIELRTSIIDKFKLNAFTRIDQSE